MFRKWLTAANRRYDDCCTSRLLIKEQDAKGDKTPLVLYGVIVILWAWTTKRVRHRCV